MGNVRIAEERKMMKKIEFIASLPPIQSAINIDGQGNGARIKLDIPATELNRVIELQGYIGMSFKVTIEPGDE
jgi:hypothetical protein